MYYQEKALNVLRKRRFKAAAEKIFEVAKNGMPNGKIAAICALREFNNKETSRMIKELKKILSSEYEVYLRG